MSDDLLLRVERGCSAKGERALGYPLKEHEGKPPRGARTPCQGEHRGKSPRTAGSRLPIGGARRPCCSSGEQGSRAAHRGSIEAGRLRTVYRGDIKASRQGRFSLPCNRIYMLASTLALRLWSTGKYYSITCGSTTTPLNDTYRYHLNTLQRTATDICLICIESE